MKATRDQVTDMLVQVGLIEPGCWLVDGNKYEALVHLAQQFTLDQLRAQEPYCIDREYGIGDIELHHIPETLE